MKTLKFSLVAAALLGMATVHSAPWIDPDDPFLRHDLQTLADAGVIKTPLNTWPVMWASIDEDLQAYDESALPEHLQFAFARVNFSLQQTKSGRFNTRFRGGYSTEDPVSYGFGDRPRTNGLWLESSQDVVGERFAGRLNVARGDNNDALDEDSIRFDGSYIAGVFGNWAISAGWQNRWWGPGNDTALLLSNNARPVPAISLSRVNSSGFETPWLSWIGDWHFTTFLGRFEDERFIDNALLWGMRANFRPFRQLEIGLSRSIQLGGDGRSASLDTFLDAFVGKDNPEGERGRLQQEPGNQLAGIDIRYSFTLFDQPFAAYGEVIGEDEEGGLPNKTLKLIGAEWFYGNHRQQTKVFIEFTDTETQCFVNSSREGDCAYEHDIYLTGYRQYLRSLGSTYDSDSRTLVIGASQELNNGHAWQLSLKYLELNRDGNQPPNPLQTGNPLTDVSIDTPSVTGNYRLPLGPGLLTLGGEWFNEGVAVVGPAEDFNLYTTWDYRF